MACVENNALTLLSPSAATSRIVMVGGSGGVLSNSSARHTWGARRPTAFSSSTHTEYWVPCRRVTPCTVVSTQGRRRVRRGRWGSNGQRKRRGDDGYACGQLRHVTVDNRDVALAFLSGQPEVDVRDVAEVAIGQHGARGRRRVVKRDAVRRHVNVEADRVHRANCDVVTCVGWCVGVACARMGGRRGTYVAERTMSNVS